MDKNIRLALLVFILAVISIFTIRFLSGEDDWICTNQGWIKHGNPSGPMPDQGCQANNQDIELSRVSVYLGSEKLNPGAIDCSKVFPVERRIAKTQATARAALEELLAGPTNSEKSEGYFTSLNDGVKIQKLTIEKGIAKVDFDKTLELNVGGSCRVTAISAQITQTLKQFSTVQSVVISIDGRTEDILQP